MYDFLRQDVYDTIRVINYYKQGERVNKSEVLRRINELLKSILVCQNLIKAEKLVSDHYLKRMSELDQLFSYLDDIKFDIAIDHLERIKIKEVYLEEVYFGRKTFELRKDDRGYEVGDLIKFKVIDKDEHGKEGFREYVDSEALYIITYILRNVPEYGLDKDYCILGIKRVTLKEE